MRRGGVVYSALRKEIRDWVLPPGTPLGEVEVSRRLNVSRTPVREAIQRLSREGLVVLVAGRGAFVSSISLPDILDLFQMREALEPQAARLAARSPSRARIADLRAGFEGARHDIDTGDLGEYYKLTSDFDEIVASLAGNGRLHAALSEVWLQIDRARRLSAVNPARLSASVGEHLAILDAIVAGDEEAAAAAARYHVQQSLQNVVQSAASGRIAPLLALSTDAAFDGSTAPTVGSMPPDSRRLPGAAK